jgi:Flp pilus assembly protein TadB
MFGRKSQPAETAAEQPSPDVDPQTGKGRPTPSRREAEAARKQQLKIPKDPKEAKKAARERDRDERSRSRAAMMAGDERYLPARDKGPVKAFTRDFVDSRFTLAEFFIFFAIGVLVLGFVRNPTVQSWVSIAFFAFTALIVVDSLVLLIQLNMRAKKQFPDAADRKGITLYASLRTLQLRRLRLPPPRVKRGGAPMPPKS